MLPTTIGIYLMKKLLFSIRKTKMVISLCRLIIDMQEDKEEENIMMKTTDGFIVGMLLIVFPT